MSDCSQALILVSIISAFNLNETETMGLFLIYISISSKASFLSLIYIVMLKLGISLPGLFPTQSRNLIL